MDKINKKIVVFGGSGFIGSHVADQLTELGADVTIFDISASKFINNRQKMFKGDIRDFEAVSECIEGAQYVYHFGGIAGIKEAKKTPIDTVQINILGTVNILEACKIHDVKRMIFASTLYVYSEIGSFYRSSKQACELLIENYHSEYGLEYCILRFGSLYGRRSNQFNYIGKAIRQAIVEGVIDRKGDGTEIRDYIHVDDAARASAEMLDQKYKNQYLLITGNQKHSIKEILKIIEEIFQGQVEVRYDKKNQMEGHYQFTPYSFKPRVALKYIPNLQYDIGQGILDSIYDTYKNLKKNGERVEISPLNNKRNQT